MASVDLFTTISVSADWPLWRMSVEQYHAMLRQGILSDGDPLELLDGLLVRKMTQNPPHRLAVELLNTALRSILPVGWHAQAQAPLTLSTSEPEPDGMVVRGTPRDYATRHPSANDAALVIEVADATLAQDRKIKGPIYAAASVQVYWIVNLVEERVEVFSQPRREPAGYALRREFRRGQSLPIALDGLQIGAIAVDDLLP